MFNINDLFQEWFRISPYNMMVISYILCVVLMITQPSFGSIAWKLTKLYLFKFLAPPDRLVRVPVDSIYVPYGHRQQHQYTTNITTTTTNNMNATTATNRQTNTATNTNKNTNTNQYGNKVIPLLFDHKLTQAWKKGRKNNFHLFFGPFLKKWTKIDRYCPKLMIKFYKFITSILLCIWYNVTPIQFNQIGYFGLVL